LALAVCVSSTSSAADSSPYEWLVSKLSGGKAALILSNSPETITLRAGWKCVVGAPQGVGGFESRSTACQRNGEEFRFVVQCEPDRPNDHTQIQFGNGGESNHDYIEVLCQPRKLALLPNTSLEWTRDHAGGRLRQVSASASRRLGERRRTQDLCISLRLAAWPCTLGPVLGNLRHRTSHSRTTWRQRVIAV
jgi:hypothetical protein